MIGLVDYGLGNINAFANIFRRLGVDASPVQTPEAIRRASRLVLPGVGAFDWAMARLTESGLREVLDEVVLGKGVPVLGVCVGMQMMADSSEEGMLPGLGWIKARVLKFQRDMLPEGTRLPHMGWNDVLPRAGGGLFEGIDQPRYYFLHSYYLAPAEQGDILATSVYGVEFASAVNKGNVFGTQFHPEKSHGWGVSLLQNFARIT